MILVFSFFQVKLHNTKAPQMQYIGADNFANGAQNAFVSRKSHDPLFTAPAQGHLHTYNPQQFNQPAYPPAFDEGNGMDEHFQGENDSYELLQDEEDVDVLLNYQPIP